MSQHHRAKHWPKVSKKARERVAATLPAPCVECGHMVTASQRWHVGHRRPLAQGGDVNDYGPAHSRCNEVAGGKLGAAVTNAKRGAVTKRRPARLVRW